MPTGRRCPAKDGDVVPLKQYRKMVGKLLPDLSPEQAELIMTPRYLDGSEAGPTKRVFLRMLQQFYEVTKPVAMTDAKGG